MNFNIVTIPENEINNVDSDCILNAFPYMVEDVDTGCRWFGAQTIKECEEYINLHTTNI
jgi:hypothetical protein